MGTRVIWIPDPAVQERTRVRRALEPAGTALMVAVSASVLAASLLIASLSTNAGQERPLTAGMQPEPAPPPAIIATMPGGGPMSP